MDQTVPNNAAQTVGEQIKLAATLMACASGVVLKDMKEINVTEVNIYIYI